MTMVFKGNLNIRIHRDITGEMWFGEKLNETENSFFIIAFITSNL